MFAAFLSTVCASLLSICVTALSAFSVRPETAPADAVVLPECRALSVLYCGDYSGVDEMWLTLGREARARGLTPAEPPRTLGIVAPYTGREIETQRYCSRLVLPVKE